MPTNITIDFETGMIAALNQVYPLSDIHGCLFHLSKNTFKHVQASGLQQLYINNHQFRENIRLLAAITFVPIPDIVAVFGRVSQLCGAAEQPIVKYFEQNYVGQLRQGQRHAPRFPHTLSNVNMLVQNNVPRTNNHLEGWINRFNNMLTHSHPSVWLCIQALQRDNDYNRMILAQVPAGTPPPPPPPKTFVSRYKHSIEQSCSRLPTKSLHSICPWSCT